MQRNLVIVVACDDDQNNNHTVHSQEYPHRCFSPLLNHGEQIYICLGFLSAFQLSQLLNRYVYEHSERHGFPSEWIGITFSITTFWNGMIAIFAGIISNVTAESLGFGPVAPFVVALLPLVVCGILVVSIDPFSFS